MFNYKKTKHRDHLQDLLCLIYTIKLNRRLSFACTTKKINLTFRITSNLLPCLEVDYSCSSKKKPNKKFLFQTHLLQLVTLIICSVVKIKFADCCNGRYCITIISAIKWPAFASMFLSSAIEPILFLAQLETFKNVKASHLTMKVSEASRLYESSQSITVDKTS